MGGEKTVSRFATNVLERLVIQNDTEMACAERSDLYTYKMIRKDEAREKKEE